MTTNQLLNQYGWNQEWEKKAAEFLEHYVPARVTVEHKRMYRLETSAGEVLGEISGKLRHNAASREDYPAVGDWLMVKLLESERKAVIHHVLPRKSMFSRKAPGESTDIQIVAANVDRIFIVTALNQDFNLRRLERYLLSAWESGANPVVVLSKMDLCDDLDEKIQQVESVAFGVPIIACSAKTADGFDAFQPYLTNGQTVAVMGSSGVGKSSIINALLGEERMLTHEIREDDDKGKHTTTHRELLLLPSRGMIIDTPGMRELQLWEADGGLHQGFQDIEELAEQCAFRDCRHEKEPACAVAAAIEEGTLAAERFTSYKKLQRELAYIERKNNVREQLAEKRKWKAISKQFRK